jgi:hypothetical protein
MMRVNKENYDYRLFWNECPAYGHSECSVEAETNTFSWKWTYQKAGLSEVNEQLSEQLLNSPLRMDSYTEFALWYWSREHHEDEGDCFGFARAQVLDDEGFRLIPMRQNNVMGVCRYFDFPSFRTQLKDYPYETEKKLLKALQILNPSIKKIRIRDKGTFVIFDDDKHEVSLHTLGSGAVTWASVLMSIFDVIEEKGRAASDDFPFLVLIDEMGAGIHYSAMLNIWRFIKEFIIQNREIQFVFTSHSSDCVRAYCEVFLDAGIAKIIHLYQRYDEDEVLLNEYPHMEFESIAVGEKEVR